MKLGYKLWAAQNLYGKNTKDEKFIQDEILSFKEDGFEVIIERLPMITRFWLNPITNYARDLLKDHGLL